MPKIYQQLIDKAVITGAITPEQYLQIPWNERENMQYLFSFRMQWVLTRGITFEQYMQILFNYRKITQGVNRMTFEQFLELPWYERSSMACFFSPDGQQAVADGIITFEQYLQIPWDERESLQYLFSPNGRQALAENIITLKQYLKIPVFSFVKDWTGEERNEILGRLSPLERQAVEDGIITLEQGLYLQILLLEPNKQSVLLQLRWNHRISMQYLFSPGGRQAVADGLITLEQYLQIPRYDREYVIIALQDHDTRQRIINGNITIKNIIGIGSTHDVAAHSINGIQNTHTASVHQSVSESATRLLNLYESGINGVCLENTLEKAQAYVSGLSDESTKNRAAKRGFLRMVAPEYNFTDKSSKVTIRQLLALTFLAIHDDEKRVGSLEDAQMQFVEGLYEIQRGYNLSESGVDQGGEDQYICFAGTFNKLIEKLNGIHPDGRVLYITEETGSLKLPIVVREEAMHYLTTINAEALPTFTRLMARVKKEGVEVIWGHIKNNIAKRMFDEFGSLYKDRTDPRFTTLVETGKYVVLEDLNTFQEHVQSGNRLSQHRYANSEAQQEDTINPQILMRERDILLMQLKLLENKAKILRNRNHLLAYCKAANIVRLLRDLADDYFTEQKIDYKAYRDKSLDIINEERTELDKHRGYKQILGNLLILICTLGAGQLINKARTGNFLFFKKTESSIHIDELDQRIKQMEFSFKFEFTPKIKL